MRTQDVELGKMYKVIGTSNYFRPIEIIKPGQKGNYHSYTIFKGEYSKDKLFTFGLIKHFRATNLVKLIKQKVSNDDQH